MPTPHTEHIQNWRTPNSKIDNSNLRVNNIALTGRNSKNGYEYSPEALQQAVPLYDNKPVFLDHAANITRPHDRSTRDLVGSIINPRYEADRIRGDIQLLGTEAGRTFLALAAAKNPAVGMSHVVLAERNTDRTIVEKIHEVVSVDAVTFPATTSTFSESKRDNPSPALAGSLDSLIQEIDTQLPTRVCQLLNNPAAQITRRAIYPQQIILEVTTPDIEEPQAHTLNWHINESNIEFANELKASPPDRRQESPTGSPPFRRRETPQTWPAFLNQSQTLQQKLDQTTTENNQLQEQLTQHQQQAAQQQEIEQLLNNSNLPPSAITNLFRQQLQSAPNTTTRQTLIHDREQLITHSHNQPPHSHQRNNPSTEPDETTIINTLKHQRPNILTGITQ